MPLKSAWELALERSGGAADKPLTDEQKQAIGKVRAEYAAKRKELRFNQEQELQAKRPALERMDDQETIAKIKAEHAQELARLEAAEEAAVEAAKQ